MVMTLNAFSRAMMDDSSHAVVDSVFDGGEVVSRRCSILAIKNDDDDDDVADDVKVALLDLFAPSS